MNPSYDNGFGSFGSGGTAPGMGSGVGGTFGSGGPSGAGGASGMAFTGAGLSSGESGDVIIGGGAPAKKSRKGVVIGIVVALLLIAAGVGVWVMMRGGGNIGGQQDSSLRRSFNELANYVVGGAVAESDLEMGYDENADYYFLANSLSSEDKVEVYNKTKQLTDNFKEVYDSIHDKEKYIKHLDVANIEVNKVSGLIEFIDIIYKKRPINVGNIIDWYLTGGEDGVSEGVAAYYGFSSIGDNEYAVEFKTALENWNNSIIDKIKLFQSNGCDAMSFDDACVNEKGDSVAVQLNDINQSAASYRQRMISFYDLSDRFIYDIFVLRDLIYGNEDSDLIVIDSENESEDDNEQ